ncbi:reverse transcriptase domain-containing protein [Tanacetum coccineum]
MDLKTQLETVAKNHQVSIQNLETKFDRLADKQSGRPSGSLPSNTQPNPKAHNSQAYQPPQSRNEHVNDVFTRSADLGASINLMPYSLYAKLYLETLKPTKMSVRLADRSFQYPVEIAENMLVEIGKFTFPVNFVILEIEEDKEDFNTLLDEGSKILYSIEGTLLEEEIFAEFDEFIAMTADENSDSDSDIEDPPLEKITINTDYKIKTSLEEPPKDIELKPLPDNLEYVFLEEPSFLPVIISSQLSKEKKNKLIYVSPIHYVPKKGGITVVTNKNDELVPTRTVMGWRANAFRAMQCSCHIPKVYLAIFHDMIEESVKVFMDDFSVFGNSFDTCLNNLDKMLQRCKDAHLVLNWEKCHFMVKEGIMLGHKVSSAGLEVDKAKIDVISKLPPPTNIKGILEKDTPFEFDDECQKAFESLKEKLTCAPVIVSPNWNLPFKLMCDASDFAVGVVLGQKDVFVFDKFRSYLILSKTIIHTDQSALRHLFNKQDAKPRLIRWILLLQEFNIEIKDRKRTENVQADYLSRIENDETSDDSEVDDNFLGETLMEINTKDEPWFADFANYLVVKHRYPSGYVELYGKDGKTFIVNGHRLKLYHEEDNDSKEAITPFFPKE